MIRSIAFRWQEDPVNSADDGWIVETTEDDGDLRRAHVTGDPLPRDAEPAEVLAAYLRHQQRPGGPCLSCGQDLPESSPLAEQILTLRADGLTQEQIRQRLGLASATTVARVLQRYVGASQRGRRKALR